MAEPFLAEIRIASFNFPPKGWALCNGQLLPINQNQALFSLLGTTYGGNGQTNFALPNMRGRAPMHHGAGWTQGTAAGASAHTVTVNELPTHSHMLNGVTEDGTTNNPSGNLLAKIPGKLYDGDSGSTITNMQPASLTSVGGSQPHTNMQPYLVLNFIIALQGIFPSPN